MFPAHQPKGNLTPIFGRCNQINNILKKLQTKGIKNESVHYKLANSQKSFLQLFIYNGHATNNFHLLYSWKF